MMSRKRIVVAFALLCGTLSTTTHGQNFHDHKTRFTFTRAAELPGGITLVPGRYTFRLAESSANRYLVDVLNEDETHKFATILAVDPVAEAVVMFGDTPSALPQPMRFWYHSGRTVGPVGYEFVYPKDQAARIARTTNQPVLMTSAPLNDRDTMKRAEVNVLDPNGMREKRRANARRSRTSPVWSTARTREPTAIAPHRHDRVRLGLSEGAGVPWFVALSGLMLVGAVLIALRFHSPKMSARSSILETRWTQGESPHTNRH